MGRLIYSHNLTGTKFLFGQKLKIIYFLMIASLVPLIKAQIIYNTTIFDFINMIFIIFFLTYIFAKRKLQIPLLVPMAIIIYGSLISMFNAQVLLINSIILIIDLYLFIFFIVLYNIIETKRELRIFILFWMIFAILQSSFILYDIFPNFVGRGYGTFLNPNMASNYLGLSFFLIFQPYAKMGKFLTWLFGLFILSGMLATKSLAGIIALFISVLVMTILYWYRARACSKIKLISAILIIVIVGLIIYPEVTKIPNFLARFPKSVYTKSDLWRTGFNIFIKNPLGCGIGPGGFDEVCPEIAIFRRESMRIELHSDWLSFLVERGVLGFLGLVLLFGVIAMMLFQTLKTINSKREFLWVIGLFGMFVFILSFAFTHEVLHFRHIWCSFALIAVEYKLRKKGSRREAIDLRPSMNII